MNETYVAWTILSTLLVTFGIGVTGLARGVQMTISAVMGFCFPAAYVYWGSDVPPSPFAFLLMPLIYVYLNSIPRRIRDRLVRRQGPNTAADAHAPGDANDG